MRENELSSVLFAAATLLLVLAGSFYLATTYLTDNPRAEAVVVSPDPLPACQQPDSCRTASAELRRTYNDPNACDGPGARICIVPIGDVSKELIDGIVSHYRKTYGLTVKVARPLDLRDGFDRRTQLDETVLYSYLYDSYNKYATDRSVTLIGILPIDLFLPGQPSWEWGFGRLRGEPKLSGGGIDYRSGVISTFRMDPRNSGQPANVRLRDERVIKLLSKYIALAYYDLPLSNDPTVVTYNGIATVEDLDRVNERIPGH